MKRLFVPLVMVASITALVVAVTTTQGAVVTPQHYSVEGNETYTQIAAKLGVSVDALRCANRTSNSGCPAASSSPGGGRIIHVPNVSAPPSTTAPGPSSTVSPSTTQAPTTTAPTTTTTPTPTTQPPAGTLYANTFDSAAALGSLKFQIEPPGPYTDPLRITSFNGDHALNADGTCGGADTTRPLTEDHLLSTHVYFCNAHFMTAMNSGAYVTIAFTPSANGAPIIFPGTANKVCWDRNETNIGGRKWIEVSVISDNHFAANGTMIYQNPIFNGNITSNAVMLSGDDFQFRDLNNSVEYFVGQNETTQQFLTGVTNTDDKMTRYQECLRDNGNGTVTRTLASPTGLSTVTGAGAFPAGPRVFIIADVTYDADKEAGTRVANPYTWHWDNIEVLP